MKELSKYQEYLKKKGRLGEDGNFIKNKPSQIKKDEAGKPVNTAEIKKGEVKNG
jgi:hypothetical protein